MDSNRVCKVCGKTFKARSTQISKGTGIYCSRKCMYEGRTLYPRKHINNRICKMCNKTFYTSPSIHAIYCSAQCRITYLHLHHEPPKNNRVCACCGKEFYMRKSRLAENGKGIYCSRECQTTSNMGENNTNWKGGISFEPYCPKFNEDLKRRIRAFFDNRCVLCGKSSEENNGKNMGCHHVSYDKMICCNGNPVRFSALCISCHGRTNNDRPRWEAMLHRIIDEIYGGRSYYTKDEWTAIQIGERA